MDKITDVKVLIEPKSLFSIIGSLLVISLLVESIVYMVSEYYLGLYNRITDYIRIILYVSSASKDNVL